MKNITKSKVPLYRKLYQELREDIMSGIYRPGDFLPSIREYAARLGVARNTVENTYRMLEDEGYIYSRRGVGSQVLDVWQSFHCGPELPDPGFNEQRTQTRESFRTQDPGPDRIQKAGGFRLQSTAPFRTLPPSFSRSLTGEAVPPYTENDDGIQTLLPCDFRFDRPSVMLPNGLWKRLEDALRRDAERSTRAYALQDAEQSVCAQIRRYLRIYRGVVCVPEQICLCRDLPQAIRLVRLVQRNILYVVPHHEGDKGNHISFDQTEKIFRKARTEGACLLEDDMDGELVYERRPYPTLYSMNPDFPVVLTGSLTHFIGSWIQLQYVVFPFQWVENRNLSLAGIRSSHRHSLLELRTLEALLGSDRWDNDLRKAHHRHAGERKAVLRAARRFLGEEIELHRTESGTELIAVIPRRNPGCRPSSEAAQLVQTAAENGLGICVRADTGTKSRNLYVTFRYAGVPEEEMERGLHVLSGLL